MDEQITNAQSKISDQQKEKATDMLTLIMEAEVIIEKEKFGALKAELATGVADAKSRSRCALKAVSGIRKKDLDEIRALRKPSHLVEKTMDAVCLLMVKKTKYELYDWKKVQKIMDKNFIPDILNFDTNNLTAKRRKKVIQKYIDDERWTYERVNKKASRALGPLVLWVKHQVKWSQFLDELEILKAEFIVSRSLRLYSDLQLPDVVQEQIFRFFGHSFSQIALKI